MDGQDNWRASGSGVSLSLDGTNDCVTAPDRTGLTGNAAYTFSAWIRVLAGTSGAIAHAGGPAPWPCLIRVGTTGNVSFSRGATNCTVYGAFTAGVWTHLAFVYPGTVIRDVLVYSNGNSLAVATDGGVGAANVAINWVPTTFYLGSLGGTDYLLNGSIDDARIYNRVLTPAEIRLLASRRGIGLTPLPDRGGGLPRKLSVNVGGTWRAADAYVRTATDWRLSQASVNVGGTWK